MRVGVCLRMEIVLCFVEREVRQKEQRQAEEKNRGGKPTPEAICDWKSHRTHTCPQQ